MKRLLAWLLLSVPLLCLVLMGAISASGTAKSPPVAFAVEAGRDEIIAAGPMRVKDLTVTGTLCPPDDMVARNLTVTGTLTVRSDDGGTVTIVSGRGATGVWVVGPGGKRPQVAMHYVPGQGPAVTLYGDTAHADACRANLALALDAKGEPVVQVFSPDGAVKFLTMSRLMELADGPRK